MMEKFHYEADGKKIVLPKFADVLTFGFARKTRKMSQAEQMFELVEAAADAKALAVIDGLRTEQMEEFFTAWQKHSGVGVGESKDSSAS